MLTLVPFPGGPRRPLLPGGPVSPEGPGRPRRPRGPCSPGGPGGPKNNCVRILEQCDFLLHWSDFPLSARCLCPLSVFVVCVRCLCPLFVSIVIAGQRDLFGFGFMTRKWKHLYQK